VLDWLASLPMLLYGEELGLAADRPEHLPENVWPDRMPMPWPDETARAGDEATNTGPNAGPNEGPTLRATLAALTALRRRTPALAHGELTFTHGEDGVLVYRREADGEVIDVALNTGPTAAVSLDDDAVPGTHLLLAIGPASLAGSTAHLGPGGAVVVRREAALPLRRLHLAGTAKLRDRDFEMSAIALKSRPSRLDFAVTERCNLRCAHCITHAPERTAARTARALSPWLIDRLRDDLAHADHFAFVHGGESMVSPLFEPLLDAIREARGFAEGGSGTAAGLPTMVHLLTNGVLLSAATAERLARRGVRSISVSLDGATAAVNDAIREGGRFAQIVENVRAVVRLRRDAGLDLRLGVSSVVLAQNLAQLDGLVDLCGTTRWPPRPGAARSRRGSATRGRSPAWGERVCLPSVRRASFPQPPSRRGA
jgi:cyclomaltodextrinase